MPGFGGISFGFVGVVMENKRKVLMVMVVNESVSGLLDARLSI